MVCTCTFDTIVCAHTVVYTCTCICVHSLVSAGPSLVFFSHVLKHRAGGLSTRLVIRIKTSRAPISGLVD